MTAFRYRALDSQGENRSGVIEANSARNAREMLRDQKLFPVEVAELGASGAESGTTVRQKLRTADLALLTRQWSTLLLAGLSVDGALSALIEQTEKTAHRQLLAAIRSDVLAGHSLSNALERFPRAFPPIYRASISAGERSGELANVMLQLADYLEQQGALQRKLLQAFLYPSIVAVVALLVVVALMVYVVPQVTVVFEQGNQSLPPLTRALMAVSSFMVNWGWLLATGTGLALLAFVHAVRQPGLRVRWHAMLLRAPLLGGHLRAIDTARFASTLGILTASGVPLLQAMEAGARVMSLDPMKNAVRSACELVRGGQSLSRALRASRAFPPVLVHLVANGEATGQLDVLLARSSALTRKEVEDRTSTLTTLLEPVVLLIMGGLVLLIVLAVMQPIIELNTMMR